MELSSKSKSVSNLWLKCAGFLGMTALATTGAMAAGGHVNADTVNNQGSNVTQTANQNVNSGQSNIYVVKSGDTLSGIAASHNTTVANLKAINHLSSDLILVGQKLQLTGNATSSVSYQAPAQQTQSIAQPVSSTAQSRPVQANTQNVQLQAQPVQTQAQTGQSNANQGSQAATTNTNSGNGGSYTSNLGGSEQAAKNWIAQHESGGNYNARNGQ